MDKCTKKFSNNNMLIVKKKIVILHPEKELYQKSLKREIYYVLINRS